MLNARLSFVLLLLLGACSVDETPRAESLPGYTESNIPSAPDSVEAPMEWMFAADRANVYSERDTTRGIKGFLQKGDLLRTLPGDTGVFARVVTVPHQDTGYVRRSLLTRNQPPSKVSSNAPAPSTSAPSAEVVSARVVPFSSPLGPAQMVLINWKNTGGTPIRTVYADIIPIDANGTVLASGASDYTIFVAEDESQLVQPGKTYREPNGEGYVLLLPAYGRAVRVRARITRVK